MERYDPKTDLEDHGKFVGMAKSEDGGWVLYADAQRALDAERERVAFLDKKNVALVEASNLVLNVKAEQDAQLATLQAQVKQLGRTLADVYQQRDGLQAQLRQVEGQSKQQAEEAVIVFAKYTTLRQLVEVWRKLLDYVAAIDRPLFVRGDHAETYEARCQYIANRARAALAAQDAGKEDVSHE